VTPHIDRYANGIHISARRRQKAGLLGEAICSLFPDRHDLTLVDFGCADGAIPVLMLESSHGAAIQRYIGLTKLDYNDLPDKPAFTHPRFERRIADLSQPVDDPALPWGACDAVTATAFFHYFAEPAAPFALAARLLKPGGYLLAGMPAPWVLALRRRGIPCLLPRNNYIRTVQSIAAWRRVAAASGFAEVSCRAVQWCGAGWSAPLERWLARRHLPTWCGSNALVIYQR
jgi:SAM-dependent methyltransferase